MRCCICNRRVGDEPVYRIRITDYATYACQQHDPNEVKSWVAAKVAAEMELTNKSIIRS